MMKGFKKDLNGDQRIMSLKQKATDLRGKVLGNGVKTCPYKRHNKREDELKHKIRSTVSLKEKVKHFKEEGFDKENNNREDKHQLCERKSRVCHKNYDQKYINGHKRHQNDDGMEAGERSTVSLREKAKQHKDTGSHTIKTKYQNERVHYETNNVLDSGDEVIARLKERAKQLRGRGFGNEINNREGVHRMLPPPACREDDNADAASNPKRKRHQNDDGMEAGKWSTVSLKEKAKQLKDIGSHTIETKHQNERVHHETNNVLDSGDEVVARLKARAKQLRGRGFGNEINNREGVHRMLPPPACHEDDNADAASNPQRSAEGWILFVTNIADEADEDDIQDKFCDYGAIMNLSMNVDRRTGFCKGYALVQFETYEDASSAKDALDGAEIMGQPIKVDWCFIKGAQRVQKLAENRRH